MVGGSQAARFCSQDPSTATNDAHNHFAGRQVGTLLIGVPIEQQRAIKVT